MVEPDIGHYEKLLWTIGRHQDFKKKMKNFYKYKSETYLYMNENYVLFFVCVCMWFEV